MPHCEKQFIKYLRDSQSSPFWHCSTCQGMDGHSHGTPGTGFVHCAEPNFERRNLTRRYDSQCFSSHNSQSYYSTVITYKNETKKKCETETERNAFPVLFLFNIFLVQNTGGMNFIPVARALTKASISANPYICKGVPIVAAGCFIPRLATWFSPFCWLFSLIQSKLHGVRQAAYFSSTAKQSNPHCILVTIVKLGYHRNYTW